jgi:hypothetical protein
MDKRKILPTLKINNSQLFHPDEGTVKVDSKDERGRRRWKMSRTLLFTGIVPPVTG